MRTVVTGATGFVGRWLVNELIKQNDKVTIIVRNKKKILPEWKGIVEVIEAELEQLSHLSAEDFSDGCADIFFHFAWTGTSGQERADVNLQLKNVQFTCDAVQLAGQLKCKRFVNAGSIMEYEAVQFILRDAAKPGMGNIYSIAKLTADFMAKTVAVKIQIDYINVIISNIYGSGEYSSRFINTTLRKMLNNEDIPLSPGTQLYDFIYVTDAVKAIVFVGKKGEQESSYYIGNSNQRLLKEYVTEMKQVLKSESNLLFGEVPFKGARLTYEEFDTKKLEKLGFVPEVSFTEGIRLTRNWILEGNNEY